MREIEKIGSKAGLNRDCNSPVDKTKKQSLNFVYGSSVGYKFECLDPPVWKCRGENCNIEIIVNEDSSLIESGTHHTR